MPLHKAGVSQSKADRVQSPDDQCIGLQAQTLTAVLLAERRSAMLAVAPLD